MHITRSLLAGRALAKTATFAAVHFMVAFLVAYALTGSVAISGTLALVEPLANTLAYHLHELAWQRLRARRGAVASAA